MAADTSTCFCRWQQGEHTGGCSYPLGFAETSHFTDVSIVGLCFFRLVSPFSAGFPALASLAKSCEVSRELGDKWSRGQYYSNEPYAGLQLPIIYVEPFF